MKVDLHNYIKKIYRDFETKDADEIVKVLKFAKKKHKNTKRDDGSPYILHPMRVAELVKNNKRSKNQAMLYKAALLHDTLEDTYTSYRELKEKFTEDVASLVMELSTAKLAILYTGNGEKSDYLSKKMLNMSNYALYIKLCDRLDNITDLNGCEKSKQDQIVNDTKVILNFLKKNRKFTESQQKIVVLLEKEIEKHKKNA